MEKNIKKQDRDKEKLKVQKVGLFISKKNLLILLWFILPPIIIVFLHIKAITINDSAVIPPGMSMAKSSGANLPQNNPQDIDKTEFETRDNTSRLIPRLNNISRYSFLLDLQPNIIRHTLILDHDLSVEFEYADNPNGKDVKRKIFQFILSCVGNKVDNEPLRLDGLRLNDENNDDRQLVENVIKDCLYFPFGGFSNNGDQTLYLYNIDKHLFKGQINLTTRPDLVSKIIILIGWYIFWISFILLLREGPGKYLKKS
ncbi:MAG: hypothetical protein WC768_01640 [Patescibacteria group bacterium]|jgi:hypothetical protein